MSFVSKSVIPGADFSIQCNLGVADWHGREQIRENLRAFIDTGFTALHDVVEYWDGGSLKVFRGTVTMTRMTRASP